MASDNDDTRPDESDQPDEAPESESAQPDETSESDHPDTPDLPRAELIGGGGGRFLAFFDSRLGRAVEVAIVTALALAILVPGIWRYSLVDPWETHYAEVGRRMLQDDDLVHTKWQNEGFRSKPVLTPWLIAGGIRAMGHGELGGYSGEMTSSTMILVGARLPFVLFGALGLVLIWWMLARAVRRRVAWLAFAVIITCPFYFFIARQAITDMPLVGCLMGALACFAMALHSGDDELEPIWKKLNAYHLFLAALFLFVGWQLIYYAIYFAKYPNLAHGVRFPAPHVVIPLFMALGLALFVFWSPLFGLLKFTGSWLWEKPTKKRQVYMYWFYTLLGVSVLTKGLPGIGIAGAVCLVYVILTNSWRDLGKLSIPRGVLLVLLVVVPWHLAMYLKDGRPFLRDYIISHNFKRATAGMHGERGTFEFMINQLGIGMWPWVALIPAAIAGAIGGALPKDREGRVRLLISLWAIVAVALFSLSQTKFHHYIFPAVPAIAILIAFWLDDYLSGRVRRGGALLVAGVGVLLLLTRDLMGEQKQLIELFVYRYDRPWPSGEPWLIDLSDQIFQFGLLFAVAFPLLAIRKIRTITTSMIAIFALAWAVWGMNDYMKHAGTHWGMRDALVQYYKERHIYGIDIRYYGLRQLAEEWDDFDGTLEVESVIPETMAAGRPMTVRIELMKDGRNVDQTILLEGRVSDYGDDWFEIEIPPDELGKIERLVERGKQAPWPRRRAWRQVNADRLIAWQLYWRGENFWSGDEIWHEHPDTKTAFKQTDNKEFLKYLSDPARAGKRYFVITESGRAKGLRGVLPTPRAKATFEILNTDSNKFTLVRFTQ